MKTCTLIWGTGFSLGFLEIAQVERSKLLENASKDGNFPNFPILTVNKP